MPPEAHDVPFKVEFMFMEVLKVQSCRVRCTQHCALLFGLSDVQLLTLLEAIKHLIMFTYNNNGTDAKIV